MKRIVESSEHSFRLREFRNALGLNVAEFSRSLNVPRSTLVGWENGKSVSIGVLQILKNSFGMNLDWFLTGDGEMFLKTETVSVLKNDTVSHLPADSKCVTVTNLPEEKEPEKNLVNKNDTVSFLPASGQEEGRKSSFQILNSRHLRQPRNLELYKYRKGKGVPVPMSLSTVDPQAVAFIPLFSQRAAAGPGQEATQLEETEGLIPIVFDLFGLHRPESCGIVQVVGDSMSDISLFNGDWCIFDRVDIQGDGIFVISMFGEMRVKRLQYRLADRKIIIASENQKRYPDAEIISAEMASNGQLLIHGRVFAWFHKHPY